jgi:hypothetical protein
MFTLPSIIFAFVMGFFMSLTVTLATTFIHHGFTGTFFIDWLEAWTLAYPIVIACIVFYRPLAMKITGRIASLVAGFKARHHPH